MTGPRMLTAAAALVGALAIAASGLVVIGSGERGVVRRFGRLLPVPWSPGLHWAGPLGIDRVTRVRTQELRRIDVGRPLELQAATEPGAGEFLTGDRNLLVARAVVQYRVIDPQAFVLRSSAVDSLLRHVAESALARGLAARGVDLALREGRDAVAAEVHAGLDEMVTSCAIGVDVVSVNLAEVRPPDEVAADFAAAQAARSERDRRLREARAYQESTRTAARAAAQAVNDRARAEAARTETMARARAGRFLDLLSEVARARSLTMARLYRDTLRDLLPHVRRKVVIATGQPVDLSLFGADPEPAHPPTAQPSKP